MKQSQTSKTHAGPTLMFACSLVGGTGFALIVTPEIVGSNTKVGGTSRDKVKSCYTKKWQPRWLGLLLGKSCPMEATG